ncbi:MAG: hypothetical protein J2P57_03870 [Acidimicrobiaceae bacterium]|nr:hypothetical protein [Acidimicrobiaceae bacterium]
MEAVVAQGCESWTWRKPQGKATVTRWEHAKQALSHRHRVILAALYGRSPSDFEE